MLATITSFHLPPSRAEVENEWSFTFISPHIFMAWFVRTKKISPIQRYTFAQYGIQTLGVRIRLEIMS
jgi:hypothetical protein